MTERDDLARLWTKIVRSEGCWTWTGSHDTGGYPHVWWNGKLRRASRVIYEICRGPIGGYHVLHHCDNQGCVNPDHFFLGSNADNVRDMVAKGRGGTSR